MSPPLGKDAGALVPPVTEVPAAHLLGRDLPGGWRVVEVWSQDYSNSGGEFSIAYYVENRDGRRAFMKALNVSAALGAGEGRVVDRLKAFADAYVYERDLLRTCRNRRLSRVIRLLDFGELEVPEAGVLRQVPYLILELAEGDIRSHQSKLAEFDLAWVLRTMKHATQGIEQLHYAHTTHQDLRPSNILIQQSGREMKLGDLGRILAAPNGGACLVHIEHARSPVRYPMRPRSNCTVRSTDLGSYAPRAMFTTWAVCWFSCFSDTT
jgi:serine/threonine protein kinase